MRVIVPSDPFDRAVPDAAFAGEAELALARGLATSVVDVDRLSTEDEALGAVHRVAAGEAREPAVYRGWMMPPERYARLHMALGTRGVALLTSPAAYRLTHHLPCWYPSLADHTPRSVWTPSPRRPYRTELAHLLSAFGDHALVLKDYVKSEKHAWNEACFIPRASDLDAVERVLDRFIELRDGNVEGGFVFREFVALEPVGVHPKSRMPLTREHRLVFWRGRLVAGGGYWEAGDPGAPPPAEPFASLAGTIASPFFTMDVARRASGEWVIVVLGDGQVAGLRADQGLAALYDALRGDASGASGAPGIVSPAG
ncbi:MAG: ATP-grasp domain-containing protein [Deltaproteobacteria bacterium]|nr:ATP-grasp domain-containing protein [Deltaproteobacteria bacterium]